MIVRFACAHDRILVHPGKRWAISYHQDIFPVRRNSVYAWSVRPASIRFFHNGYWHRLMLRSFSYNSCRVGGLFEFWIIQFIQNEFQMFFVRLLQDRDLPAVRLIEDDAFIFFGNLTICLLLEMWVRYEYLGYLFILLTLHLRFVYLTKALIL